MDISSTGEIHKDIFKDSNANKMWWEEKIKQATWYNRLGLWIALILYPLWSLLDYMLAPDELLYSFFYARCFCAFIMLLFALVHLKFKFNPDFLAYPVVLTISADIAYKTNVVPTAMITPYMIQYCTLFVCSAMLHIWRIKNSVFTVIYTIVVMIVLKELVGQHSYSELLSNGGLIIITVLIVYVGLIETRLALMKKAFVASYNMNLALEEVSNKNAIIEKKNLQIIDSINYGKRIQNAFLPNSKELVKAIGEHLIFYRPKNVVSGDFYWFAEKENKIFFAVADCTGHGVPGAFMSIIGASLLNQLVHESELEKPAQILDNLRKNVKKLLKQESNDVRDGMEIGLICFDTDTRELQYSGARISLWLVDSNGRVTEIEADRQAIGGLDHPNFEKYINHKFKPEQGSVIFMSSDGYPDQFNFDNKKIGRKKTKELCVEFSKLNPKEAQNELINHFDKWKGDYDQIDDILLAGIWLDQVRTS